MTPALRLLPALLLCAWAPHAAMAQGAGHAHEHGVSQLDVALDGHQLALVLAGPGHNFVGFEHAPASDEDKQKMADVTALLGKPAQLFTLPAAAQCTPALAKVTPPAHDDDHDHDHDHDNKAGAEAAHAHDKDKPKAHDHSHAAAKPAHDHAHDHSHDKKADAAAPAAQAPADKAADHDHDHDHAHEGHADWRAEYQFTCAQPQLVKDIGLPLFTALPGTQELRVQAITPRGQTGGTITAAQARIVLP